MVRYTREGNSLDQEADGEHTRDLNKANNVDLFLGFHELLDSANTAGTVPGIFEFSIENLNIEQG